MQRIKAIDDLVWRARAKAMGYTNRYDRIPSLKLVVVTCMDARMDAYALLGLRPGEAHVIRNAGGIVTLDVLRSIAISQALLSTREVMIIHHTECALASHSEKDLETALIRASGHTAQDLGAFADIDASIVEAITAVRECEYLAHRNEVRGFAFEIENGRLREVTV
jgi:carbonic anhydrase